MAESAVNFLINRLATLLSQEITLLGELKRDVLFIKEELGSMKAFLRDAEAKEDTALELKEWVKQVRDVAFDIEDVLDDFLFHFARHRADGFRGHMQKIYSSTMNLRTRHRISSEIKNIKARVENISARHQRYQSIYGIPERSTDPNAMRNADYSVHSNSLLIDEAELVGIDKPKRELIHQILDHTSHLKVVSVVGMGGLGKSTLVRKVYDDVAVRKQFQSRAWLTISQTFQVKDCVKDLIQQLFAEIRETVRLEVMECTDIVRLSAFVKDFLQNRRYILVLDDVWSINSWEAIKYMLPDCNLGSRVMLTTRITDVALASCLQPHDHVHKMEPLSDKDSRTLFCKRIFQSCLCPPHLAEVSSKILKKCGGLPLAILAVSGVLALKEKDKIGEWEMILHNLGGELEGSGQLDEIKRILLFSYNDLPYYLKSCLLSLCIYPEDSKIDWSELYPKWVALGFVQENNEMSAYDIGRRYAKELVSRNLIQVASISDVGTFVSFQVHDIVREIVANRAREQNFAATANGNYARKSEKVRLLAIYDFVDNPDPQEINNCLKSVWHLEFFGGRSRLSTPALSKFLRGCCSKQLKVLNLRWAPLEEIPNEVFKLFHLKHLCLRGTKVRIIPKSIVKLQNLEFLDLIATEVTQLPVEILKLSKLREICVGNVGKYSENFAIQGIKIPNGIGKLLSLESLGAIEANGKEIVREIGKLTKLRISAITKLNREDGKEFMSSLAKLTNLRYLTVSSINEDETLDLKHSTSPTPQFLESLSLLGHLGNVPQWVISLQGLTLLGLFNSGLKEDDEVGGIEALKDLPNLELLVLNHAYEGEMLSFRAGGFKKLKELELVKLERLKWVRVEEDSLPRLQKLVMAGCKLVEELPFGIEELNKLQSLELGDMSDELMQKVKNLDRQCEEYKKITHIPQVSVAYWMNGEWNVSIL